MWDVNIFKGEKTEVLQTLEQKNDSQVFESFGFLIFKKFGMLLTGIHDDEAQKAVSLSAYDKFMKSFEEDEADGSLTPITFL